MQFFVYLVLTGAQLVVTNDIFDCFLPVGYPWVLQRTLAVVLICC